MQKATCLWDLRTENCSPENNPYEVQNRFQFLKMIVQTYQASDFHLFPALLFPMFFFSMNFVDWTRLQVVIFIKDHFLVFIKSIMFKIETFYLIIPDTIKMGISRYYGWLLRLNDYKLFSVFTLKTTLMSDFVSEVKSILCSELPDDDDEDVVDMGEQLNEELKAITDESRKKAKARARLKRDIRKIV